MQATNDNNGISTKAQCDNRLYLLRGGGVKTPVTLDIFKYGGGVYLAIVGQGVHIPVVANAETIMLELRGALYRIEAAVNGNDQGYISRNGGGR